ncbi:MAG: DUF58 domain-containing protein [Planctomycetes bacterium]|nr:DUF58 domain-containing protein [Planctomycetota bacterium]
MIDPEILKQVRRIQVRTSRLVTDVMAGGYSSVFRGSGIEFDEVREYSEGDDPRAVDWNVTARVGRPYVKKFVEERELTVLFLLDLSASMASGARERSARDAAAEFCACLALTADRSNDKVGMIAYSDRVERYVPAKKGSGHALRLVRDCLALEAAHRPTDPVPALEFLARVVRRRAVVFWVSDFETRLNQTSALSLCARRHDLIAARMLTPELDWGCAEDESVRGPLALKRRAEERRRGTAVDRPRGLVRLRNVETGADRPVDFSSPAVRRAWRDTAASHITATAEMFRRAGVDLLDIPVEAPVVDPILRFFERRERRVGHL